MSKMFLVLAAVMLVGCRGQARQETAGKDGKTPGTPSTAPAASTQIELVEQPGQGIGRSSFFGVTSRANRILYLVGNSGAMNYTFDYVKVELDRSIKDLMPRQKFQIILFSDGPPDEMKIDGQQGLHYAYAKNKAAAFDWVKKKYAKSSGGDVPDVDYFKAAFRDKSNLPQVIYVLTDGDFSIEVFDYLRQANKGKKVIINTISFMNREGEESLKKMATENGGTYRYIGEEELKKFIPPEDDSQSGTWNLND